MSVGSVLLKAREKYAHGLRVAYYRDFVRPRILRSRPVYGLTDDRCEIHVLTSQQDWLNLMWALKSFYWASGRHYGLCIHDDGSLDRAAGEQLQQHFPEARIIGRDQAQREVLPTLTDYPRCRAFRETNHLSPKLFDFRHYLRTQRMLLMDSDVLFFQEPTVLLNRVESESYTRNCVNEDLATAYTVEPADVRRRLGVDLPERFNSGLGVIQRDSLRADWLEEFLNLPGILSHFWRIEQTLFALCSARHGVELLPTEYRISLAPGTTNCVAKHYVGAVRHLMYSEGMAQVARLQSRMW